MATKAEPLNNPQDEVLGLYRTSLGLLMSMDFDPYGGFVQTSARLGSRDEQYYRSDRHAALYLTGAPDVTFHLRVASKSSFAAKVISTAVNPNILRVEIHTVYENLRGRNREYVGPLILAVFEPGIVPSHHVLEIPLKESENCRAVLAVNCFSRYFSPRFIARHIQKAIASTQNEIDALMHTEAGTRIVPVITTGLAAWLGACLSGAEDLDKTFHLGVGSLEIDFILLTLSKDISKILVRVKLDGERQEELSERLTEAFNLDFAHS